MFCAYTRPRYQVSVFMTIGPLFLFITWELWEEILIVRKPSDTSL